MQALGVLLLVVLSFQCVSFGVLRKKSIAMASIPVWRIGYEPMGFVFGFRLEALAALVLLGAFSEVVFAANKVSIHLDGEIAPECAIRGSSGDSGVGFSVPLDIGDVTQPGERTYSFTLNCNSPFGYRLVAKNGGLANGAPETAPPGFTAVVPYDVAVHIPTDGAAIDDRCSSASIKAGRDECQFSNSGNNIALGSNAQVKITWAGDADIPLAGKYTEQIDVLVASSL